MGRHVSWWRPWTKSIPLLLLSFGLVAFSAPSSRQRGRRALYSNFSHVDEAGRVVRIESYYHETADFCTGVLLSETVVLTAAHCVYRSEAEGPPTGVTITGHGQVATADTIIKHADYSYDPKRPTMNPSVLCNDVAFIFLKTGIPIPSNLPRMVVDCSPVYTKGICASHGAGLTEKNNLSRSVRRVPLPPLQNPASPFDAPGCLETKYVGNERLCQGDSGGPVMCKSPGSRFYSLIGINVQIFGFKEVEGNVSLADSCKFSVGALVSNTVAIAELIRQLSPSLQLGIRAGVQFYHCGL